MKEAPKIVSGLVVKTFIFLLEFETLKVFQPNNFPINFFALILLFQANNLVQKVHPVIRLKNLIY